MLRRARLLSWHIVLPEHNNENLPLFNISVSRSHAVLNWGATFRWHDAVGLSPTVASGSLCRRGFSMNSPVNVND